MAWEYKDVGLSFENSLSLDKWYRCFINCDKDIIKIKILDKKEIIIDREWRIHKDDLLFKYPLKKPKQKDDGKKDVEVENENTDKFILMIYPVALNYGSIGFRNTGELLKMNTIKKPMN